MIVLLLASPARLRLGVVVVWVCLWFFVGLVSVMLCRWSGRSLVLGVLVSVSVVCGGGE